MISMIWISQTALRFADTDLFATILFSLILMWIVLSFKGDEEGGVTGLLQYLIAGFLYFYTSSKFWNRNNTLPQEERTAVYPKKENNKTKVKLDNADRGDAELLEELEEKPKIKNLPPVLVENPKKKQKKSKRSSKKKFCKENTEPTVTKKETKMYESFNICKKLNRDTKSIYDELYQYILTKQQLQMNYFPHEGFKPPTQVAADDTKRLCARCGETFDIFNGLHLSSSKCNYHPRKAVFVAGSIEKLHGCCNGPFGSPPCAISNYHVTVQHLPRRLVKTSSRRHVRKDLQHSVFSLDCEMCYTTDGLEVVRVGLVNLDGLPVYDGYVKPQNKILDYNTMYSGVDKSHLQNVTITLDDVKVILSGFIQEDTILVGHALNNDLAALGLIHNTVVDTSVLFADPSNPNKKIALKTLASVYLRKTIQDDPSGHDCIDDARASLELALLQVPACAPKPFPEQTQHGPAAKRQAAATGLLWKREQLPLMEIHNFDYQFQTGMFESRERKPMPLVSSRPFYMANSTLLICLHSTPPCLRPDF